MRSVGGLLGMPGEAKVFYQPSYRLMTDIAILMIIVNH